MLYKSTGMKVLVSKIFGSISVVFICMCMLLYLIGLSASIKDRTGVIAVLVPTFIYLFMISGMTWFSIYNFWKYPNIQVDDKGLDLLVGFYTTHIAWKNVQIAYMKNADLLIVLKNKSFLLNRLYGLLIARVWNLPVVLFRSDPSLANKLEEHINKYVSNPER